MDDSALEEAEQAHNRQTMHHELKAGLTKARAAEKESTKAV
jgi:hypothetical protein